MKYRAVLLQLAAVCLFAVWCVQVSAFEWETAKPESHGMSAERLEAAKDTLAAHGTKKLLVIRSDRIVFEWYAPDSGPETRHYSASLAKALVGGMSLLVALDDGLIHVDAPVCHYVPQWKTDIRKQMITIRHLATHTSGIEDAEENNIPHMELPGWKGKFWRKDPDPFTVSRDSARVMYTPGTRYAYSNPGMAMLSYAITSAIRGTRHTDIRTLLRERIMTPIGIGDDEWSIGYGETYDVDGLPLVANWGGGSFTARAVARIGRLMLRKGNWDGKQLVDPSRVETMVGYAGMPLPGEHHGPVQEIDWSSRFEGNPIPGSGLCWYTNFDGVWKQAPRDAFAGAGAGNQILIVIPSLDMIIVRNGGNLYDSDKGEFFWTGVEKYLLNPVMNVLTGPPYPHSPVIKSVEFAPLSSVDRKAKGSDNWPITWGDDNALYTAYGDGWGFEPRTEIKLSLGIARITGGPENLAGANIRTVSGERVGQGRYGPKVSGMLMVDGVLYMLVRNTGNSQLARSEDRGQTWTWENWRFAEGFGCPAFLNFGKDYQGARDGYVYIYSHDAETAYLSADRTALARVPKNRIRDRSAYDFFTGFDTSGNPRWTNDIRLRAAVFVNPGQCYRTSVTYNPGLKRYMMCQIIAGGDSRFSGGFGIYDAPEPWGPWTTVYYTREWDTGPGESCHLPSKWMSPDGTECYLVFSGEDCFSVRKVRFGSN